MKKAIIIISSILTGLIALYFAGVIIGNYIFQPGTYVNDKNISWMEPEEADEALKFDTSEFTIYSRDGEVTIPLDEFGFSAAISVPALNLLKSQNIFAWPVTLIKGVYISDPYVLNYDEKSLKQTIKNLDIIKGKNVVAPVDAKLEKNSDGKYEIVEEEEGNKLNTNKVIDAVTSALNEGKTSVDLDEADCYYEPKIRSDNEELVYQYNLMTALNSETITIDLTGAWEVLDPETLATMVSLDDNGELVVDEEKVEKYTNELADKYETYGAVRNFVTTGGKTIQIGGSADNGIADDTYGFWMDEEITAEFITDAILAGETKTIYPSWILEGITRDPKNLDIGNSYIEISIDQQKLWLYINGKQILATDCVTGMNSVPERRTPTGIFKIWDRGYQIHLTGEMLGESWDEYVDYWMGTDWNGNGIHNAPWRSSFGGSIYQYNGSHGCINVDFNSAKILYENTDYGFPVVIY